MYRTFTKTLALVVLVATSFTACKKDKDEAVALTKENLAGTYKISAATLNGADFFQTWDACEKDDLYKLNSDLTYAREDAGTTCSNEESGTWSLPGNSKIVIYGDEYTVEKFDGKTLIVFATDSGITYKVTYSKQ